MVRKGRNRDTAWFSMIDSEWPAKKPRSNGSWRLTIDSLPPLQVSRLADKQKDFSFGIVRSGEQRLPASFDI